MFTCRLYINSGFNKSNIPYSPSILDSVANYVDVPTLDILQDAFLDHVLVKATYSQVKDADYCKVGDFYYFVLPGIKMTSSDVAYVPILVDFMTSGGGISQFDILDGVTERVCVPVADDVFGAFPEEDELMTPSQPMKLVSAWKYDSAKPYMTYVESALDYEAMAEDTTGVTYTDNASGGECTVPRTISKDSSTEFAIDDGGGTQTSVHKSKVNKTKVYRLVEGDNVNNFVQLGIDKAFALGIENGGVLNKVLLPAGATSTDTIAQELDSGTVPGHTYPTRAVKSLTAKKKQWIASGMDYIFSNAVNPKINYATVCQYGIMTASGDKVECEPSTIYHSGDTTPTVTEFDDPHLDGKPYYRFEYINGDSSFEGFWRNCVGGMQWKQIPMIFTEKKGSILDTLNYKIDAKAAYHQREAQRFGEVMSFGSAAIGLFDASFDSALASGLPKYLMTAQEAKGGDIEGALKSYSSASADLVYGERAYQDTEFKRRQAYALSQQVVQPQVAFPYNAETVRDFMGNGFLLYRYIYTPFDEHRIDRLLTMYGYKHTKNLEASDFSVRPKFSYVLAHGVSLGGNFPKWWLDGAAAQIEGGVRVWKVKPTSTAYVGSANR